MQQMQVTQLLCTKGTCIAQAKCAIHSAALCDNSKSHIPCTYSSILARSAHRKRSDDNYQ